MSVVNGVLVAIPPPPGYVVDFDNPQRQSVEASYAISAVGIAISTFFMCQRLYVKAVLRNTLGVDDCKIPSNAYLLSNHANRKLTLYYSTTSLCLGKFVLAVWIWDNNHSEYALMT